MHVSRRVYGRVVQFQEWNLLRGENSAPSCTTYIFLPDYKDPGVDRKWHLWPKGGGKQEVSHEFAWEHIGCPLDEYTYVYDPEGMSQSRIQWDREEPQRILALVRNSKLVYDWED